MRLYLHLQNKSHDQASNNLDKICWSMIGLSQMNCIWYIFSYQHHKIPILKFTILHKLNDDTRAIRMVHEEQYLYCVSIYICLVF
jgi:hypothetical protein